MSESLYKLIKRKLHKYKWKSFIDVKDESLGYSNAKFYYELNTDHIINIMRTCPYVIYQDKKKKLHLRLFIYILVVLRKMTVDEILNRWDYLEQTSPNTFAFQTRTSKKEFVKYADYFKDFFVHKWKSFLRTKKGA